MEIAPESANVVEPSESDEAPEAEEAGLEAGSETSDEAPAEPEEGLAEEEPISKKLGPGADLADEELEREALALLFASPEPLTAARLGSLLRDPGPARVKAVLLAIENRLAEAGFPVVLRQVAGRYRLMTDPELAEVTQRLLKTPKPERISIAALETLAIVAYRQPVTHAEVEAIRGVNSSGMLRSLVDRGLARVTGRADQPGSPLQYGTTREFLERFGLKNLKDLPRDGELANG